MNKAWIWGAVIGVGLGFFGMRMPGCQAPTIAYRGQVVGVDELPYAIESEKLRAENEAKDKIEYMLAEQRQRDVEYKNAVAKLGNNHAAEIADLSARYEADSSTALASMERIVRDSEALVKQIQMEGDQAHNRLLEQYQQRNALAGIISSVVGSVPGAAPFSGLINQALPLVLGLGGAAGMGALNRRGQTKVDQAYEEGAAAAKRAAEAESRAHDEAWDQAQLQMLQLLQGRLANQHPPISVNVPPSANT